MFNKEFLKTVTVMYVEDDKDIRDSLGVILEKVFKEVIVCVDGQDGLDKFKFYTEELHQEIDVIVSDINMPNLSGLEMLFEIRKIDEEVPAVLTTAHGESNYLMDAIKVNVAYYAMKPINTPELLKNIQKICMIKHQQKLIESKEQKLSSYMKIIDNVATVSKVDNDNKFVEVNELFCEVSGYEESELIGKDMSELTHSDILATVHKNMSNDLMNGKTWEGTYKSIDKSGNAFYLKMSAIPEINDMTHEMEGCIFIGFVATEDEQGKRETMQKVRQNIIEQKKLETELRNRIKELESNQSMNSTSADDIVFIRETLEKERQKNTSLVSQVKHYELDIQNLEARLNTVVESEKVKRAEITQRLKEQQDKNEVLKTNLIHTQNQLNHLAK